VNIRLLPIVLFATISLLMLKGISFISSNGTGFSPVIVSAAAQDATDANADAGAKGDGAKGEAADAMPADALPADGEGKHPASVSERPEDLGKSRSERAVLGRLRERREELNGRERQLELREQLLRAAEKRIEQRVTEMKSLEDRIGVATTKKAEQEKKEFENLAKMYSSMKAKDAARIFDRLELSIMVKVAKAMKPTKLADVMAKMSGEAAERLTIELATGGRGIGNTAGPIAELPKINGN
jgi:flagellar motility protein MotE (MotC chaperone)